MVQQLRRRGATECWCGGGGGGALSVAAFDDMHVGSLGLGRLEMGVGGGAVAEDGKRSAGRFHEVRDVAVGR